MSIDTLIGDRVKPMTELRHRLHRIPELAYEEFNTSAAIRDELDQIGIGYISGVDGAPTATIALVGDANKPCVALRADIDGLPIVEKTGLPFASTYPGRMHACGHDGHTSMLMGTASILKSLAEELPVCVKLIWQPAEEAGAGADRLCKAGVLDGRVGPKVVAIFGLHGWPELPVGMVSTRAGSLLAATDSFCIDFVGKGGHAAFPHLGRDPIVTACEAVVNLQQFVTRDLDPTEPALITVGMIHAGSAVNVIPDRARIEGTARTLSEPARKLIQNAMRRRCAGIAAANGCEVEFEWSENTPAVINDPAMADYVAKIALQTLGPDHYLPAARPAMSGEDFAYYLQKIPGCLFHLGIRPHDWKGDYPPLHSDHFDFTDAAMAAGVRMYVELVRGFQVSTR